jgi:hypothetical protein
MPLTNLPLIAKAIDMLAYDNGLTRAQLQDLRAALVKYPLRFPLADFIPAEQELARLAPHEFIDCVCGPYTDNLAARTLQPRVPTAAKLLTAAYDSIEWNFKKENDL